MLTKRLFQTILGLFLLTAIFSNTVLILPIVLILALFKMIPIPFLKRFCQLGLNGVSNYWGRLNNRIVKGITQISLEEETALTLSNKKSYIILSNHQSWLDILVLQFVLHLKVPALKFFLKDSLKWVPVLGICWWALDFPFMKRYSKAYLAKHPEKKGLDLIATQKACEKFKITPVSIMNYPEGTRLTESKHKSQNSPFHFLLKPKAGGLAYVLPVLGKRIDSIIDLSVVYPDDKTSFWSFLCGRVSLIKVNIRQINIPEVFYTMDYINDRSQRVAFQEWLNEKWVEKDLIIKKLKQNK